MSKLDRSQSTNKSYLRDLINPITLARNSSLMKNIDKEDMIEIINEKEKFMKFGDNVTITTKDTN